MNRKEIKIVFSDLDRTLLRDDDTFSSRSIQALIDLRGNGIIVVIATGRNIFSARKVLQEDLPVDYLMFSSGAGIIDWKTQQLIYENHLNKNEIEKITNILKSHKTDFMVHHPIPENHYLDFVQSTKKNPDFKRRIAIYKEFAKVFDDALHSASQFVAVLKSDEDEKFEEIKSKIESLKVIRATSPLDHKSIWLEVFPEGVSKGHSAAWLCEELVIDQRYTLGIGNDFNDLDLLEFTAYSCVVENAPVELKEKFTVIDSNNNDGFAKCMEKLIQNGNNN